MSQARSRVITYVLAIEGALALPLNPPNWQLVNKDEACQEFD